MQQLDAKYGNWYEEFDEFMNDDFGTAKVMANMFELVPVINSMKDKTIPVSAIATETFELLEKQFSVFLTEILGIEKYFRSPITKPARGCAGADRYPQ